MWMSEGSTFHAEVMVRATAAERLGASETEEKQRGAAEQQQPKSKRSGVGSWKAWVAIIKSGVFFLSGKGSLWAEEWQNKYSVLTTINDCTLAM